MKTTRWAALIASFLGACLPLAAFAQVSADQAPSKSASAQENPGGLELEEIIVTAQKRQENLQQVPISAQVFGNAQLAEQNSNTLTDLTQKVPAVHIATGDGSNQLFIRGIGSGENAAFDQSVAIFSDDVYHGRSRMSMASFIDLDRIEVLKGPQTTFFGNNAIAGALNIVSKKPGDTFDAATRLLFGMFDTYVAEGVIGGPVTDSFGARLAVTRNGDSRGWIENVSTGERVPRINNLGGRLTLDFHPSEALDATLKAEASRNLIAGSSVDTPYQYMNCPPPAPIAPGFQGLGGCANALALGLPIGLNSNKTSGLPGQGSSLSTIESALTVNYHQWNHTFTSVTGFYNYHFGQQHDLTNLPLSVLETDDITGALAESYHQVSQEFRVASPTDGPLEYQAGVYFQGDHLEDFGQVSLYQLNGLLTLLAPPLAAYLPLSGTSNLLQDERAYSVFGSIGWHATDRLRFNAGLRASSVSKTETGGNGFGYATSLYGGHTLFPTNLWPVVAGLGFLGATPEACCSPAAETSQTALHRRDHALMPSAGAQFQLNPLAMLYTTYTRGFKAGGYNGSSFPALNPADVAFGPEHVDAFEVGLKSKWLDNTLRLNLDVFRSNYKDLQVSAQVYNPLTNGYTPFIRNAATSIAQGVELESEWLVTRDFRLTANVTYLESYYGRYPNASHTVLQNYCAANAATPQCVSLFPGGVLGYQDLSGRPTDNAPRWSGSLTAAYSISLPHEYTLTTEVSPYFTSGYFLSGDQGETDDPLAYVTGYVRLDGRITLTNPDGHWSLDLIGKNLTDRVILTSMQQGVYQGAKEQPRNAALQFRYRF